MKYKKLKLLCCMNVQHKLTMFHIHVQVVPRVQIMANDPAMTKKQLTETILYPSLLRSRGVNAIMSVVSKGSA